ncbi:hypothetical protein [Mycobacterium marinum]|uniref:hypothetical protein n=1 Tax=Mycobacterium marinum TaxID=1781 RepID=UPI00356B1F2D
MAETINYVIVCCDGTALAYIDDSRPVGGKVLIAGQPGHSQTNLAFFPARNAAPVEFLTPDELAGAATANFGERSFTATVWRDGHWSWTINCPKCPKRAEVRDTTLPRIADDLAADLAKWISVSTPTPEAPVKSVAGESINVAADRPRYLIPLGVLNIKLTPPK